MPIRNGLGMVRLVRVGPFRDEGYHVGNDPREFEPTYSLGTSATG